MKAVDIEKLKAGDKFVFNNQEYEIKEIDRDGDRVITVEGEVFRLRVLELNMCRKVG